jgi:hypothetical protein
LYRRVHDIQFIANAFRLQKEAIGDRKLCTPEKPTKVDGEYSGGIHIERTDTAVNVPGAPRAYPLGPSVEEVPNAHAPGKGSKVYGGQVGEDLRLRKELLEVSVPPSCCIGLIDFVYLLSLLFNAEWLPCRPGHLTLSRRWRSMPDAQTCFHLEMIVIRHLVAPS